MLEAINYNASTLIQLASVLPYMIIVDMYYTCDLKPSGLECRSRPIVVGHDTPVNMLSSTSSSCQEHYSIMAVIELINYLIIEMNRHLLVHY